jgi:hypothetical protein
MRHAGHDPASIVSRDDGPRVGARGDAKCLAVFVFTGYRLLS